MACLLFTTSFGCFAAFLAYSCVKGFWREGCLRTALEARGALVERAVLPVLRLISEEQDPRPGPPLPLETSGGPRGGVDPWQRVFPVWVPIFS